MDTTPFISVIIPTYHDWDRLKLCLTALEKQSYPANQFEVLVVNNDPEDQPPYEVASGNVLLIEEAKPGSYAARNAGIRVAKGEVFAFTDSDCIPREHWIALAVREFKKNNLLDIVVGAIDFSFINPCNPNSAEIFSATFEMDQERYAKKRRFATANVFIRKSVFDNVGIFNSSVYSGGDFAFAKKADDAGCIFRYLPDACVIHPARSEYGQLIQKARRKASTARLLVKHNYLCYAKEIAKIIYQLHKELFRIITKRIPLKHMVRLVPIMIIYQSAKISALISPKDTDR